MNNLSLSGHIKRAHTCVEKYSNTSQEDTTSKSSHTVKLLLKKQRGRTQSYESMWVINPEILPEAMPDTVFFPGCSSLSHYGGCCHPSGERLTWFHTQWRIACKCHLDERILNGSKRHTQITNHDSQPLYFKKITENPQNSPNWISTSVVWESFRHSFQVSRLFAVQLFYWCACYITTANYAGS